jgi:hypothetical protein
MSRDPRTARIGKLVATVAVRLPGWKVYETTLAREAEPGLWQVIEFQPDKYLSSQTFTINVGLHDIKAASLLSWPSLSATRPTTASCQLTARLGELIDGKDRWWTLTPVDALDPLAAEIWSNLEKFALRDLERFRTRRAIADSWLLRADTRWFGASRMMLAALLKETGQIDKATEVAMSEASLRTGHPSQEWAQTVARRITETSGC